MATQLSDWRAAIDVLDGQLLTLLNLRAKLACKLAKVKRETGMEIVDLERERQVLARLLHRNQGPLDHAAVERIFMSIIQEARRVQTGAE
jgi:chorismate mutase